MRNLQLESTKLEIRSKCVKRSPEKFADNENIFGKSRQENLSKTCEHLVLKQGNASYAQRNGRLCLQSHATLEYFHE